VSNLLGGTVGTAILHGYCAEQNPFEKDKAAFTNNPQFFLVYKANILNDEFAVRVNKFMNERGVTTYSCVGHSQGGVVCTHLLNYYHSGVDGVVLDLPRFVQAAKRTNPNISRKELLDLISYQKVTQTSASSVRPIQSVGSPYQGTTGAGNSATLISMFGVGCGSNSDLSLDGAIGWLSGISMANRGSVYYYTTTYYLGSWFGDACSSAVNMVLQWPNDGVTELVYAKLEGGHPAGNTEKQCHTTDMNYPPQYWDTKRNIEINNYTLSS